MNILFFRIIWMEFYNGRNNERSRMPYTGGEYVDEYREGGEESNFLDIDGYCYGYFSTKSSKSGRNKLHIEKLEGIDKKANKAEDVLVVWVSKDKWGNPKIVGWYKNATVYRDYQDKYTRNCFFNVKSKAEDCVLLPLSMRSFDVPVAGRNGVPKGEGFGQANVWYALEEQSQPVVNNVIKYIEGYKGIRINKVFKDSEIEELSFEKFNSGDKYFERGNEHINAEKKKRIKDYDYLMALRCFNSAIEFNKDDSIAFYNKAFCLANLRKYNKAIEVYEKIVGKLPYEYDAYFSLGNLYYKIENIDKSIENYNKSIEINTELEETYYHLANALKYKNDYVEALKNYKICIDKDNKFLEPYFEIAAIEYNINKDVNKAIEYYDKIIAIDKEDLDAMYQEAYIFKEEGKTNYALNIINDALEIDGENTWFLDLKDKIIHNK
ncbi:tetratricopeptide repeat protein [Clostridium sp.]|uniref:tetratricopeptide repeat protein n=1 Tax=Clostridium sp. TaxID=1506 RepID=UPI003D6C94A7